MRTNKIKVFYNPKQVLAADRYANFSKSPLKPKLLLEHLAASGLDKGLDIVSKFRPFNAYDFGLAHTNRYIKSFFTGGSLATSNGLQWSEQFADSVRYTNASLYEAIKNSLVNPGEVSFSPTSGFHHATPNGGRGFCTFSGQAIASTKLWRQYGAVGCYIDLDGHYGNSLEDTRIFQPDLEFAVPRGFNFNTNLTGEAYYDALKNFLINVLAPAIVNGKIDYVVWCHGADSHEWDDLGHQVSTEQWIRCSTLFWTWVKSMDEILERPLPVSFALFGGYRRDSYESVLSLHAGDIAVCMQVLLGLEIEYKVSVLPRPEPQPLEYGHRDFFVNRRDEQTYVDRNRYIPSSDLGVRRKQLDQQEEFMRKQRERDRLNEEEFEKFYAIRQRLNGRS